MYHLSGQDILHIWERGLAQHWIDRALTILSVALPSVPYTTLANLSIGKRDSLLFAIREQTFGPRFDSQMACPACQVMLEFSFDAATVGMSEQIELDGPDLTQKMQLADYEVQFHLPTSVDLATLVSGDGSEENTSGEGDDDFGVARRQLMRQCVLVAHREGEEIQADMLPEMVVSALADHMAECNPRAQVELVLDCHSCCHKWQTTFDIVSFFWTEISGQAKRLLYEVDTLARAYGWREIDILSMSAARRYAYIEMVT